MKKICYITTTPGTIRTFILPTINYIHNNTDWEISVICCYDADFQKELPEYVRYFSVPMKRGMNYFFLKNINRIKTIFREEKFDLIQYSTPNASLCASIAGWLAKVPVRIYCQWGIVYSGYSGKKRKALKAEEKLVCNLSTVVEPDSFGNLKFSISEKLYNEDKGRVIGSGSACGIDTNKFDVSKKEKYRTEIRTKYNIPSSSFVYVFVGRINKDKGINELISAYKSIVCNDKNTYLLLVGREEKTEILDQDLYAWSKAEESVIYTGISKEVEKYLAAADCYILPSYREGFGMGVIEAEAMKVPVITTDIPGPTDAINDKCALTVPAKDSDALARAMKDIQALDLYKMGEEGYKLVIERYEQEQLLAKILEDRKRMLGV